MRSITYSYARNNLAETMAEVCNDHSPTIITRRNGEAVVMCSLQDYHALEETAYLLGSTANAIRLMESVAEFKAGGGVPRELIE